MTPSSTRPYFLLVLISRLDGKRESLTCTMRHSRKRPVLTNYVHSLSFPKLHHWQVTRDHCYGSASDAVARPPGAGPAALPSRCCTTEGWTLKPLGPLCNSPFISSFLPQKSAAEICRRKAEICRRKITFTSTVSATLIIQQIAQISAAGNALRRRVFCVPGDAEAPQETATRRPPAT